MSNPSQKSKGKYIFATAEQSYEDYSSGRVLYGASGATNFPVRLSSEIFQRCKSYLSEGDKEQSYVIWDAFCGVAYSMTVLGLLHNPKIQHIYASDADESILETAKKNLYLLKKAGLNQRVDELEGLVEKFNKQSHKDALVSANNLKQRIGGHIDTDVFQFNVLTDPKPLGMKGVDIMIVDLPYGQLTDWNGLEVEQEPTQIFLNNIKTSLNPRAIIAIVSDKKQKIYHDGYSKLKSFNLGKRKIWFFEYLRNKSSD